MQETVGQELVMEESDGKLLWHMGGCPLCHERHTDEPACQLAVGLAEESLYWLSGGKMFQVEESTCIARGDSRCTLQVDLAPLS
jgi:predicted hydrocarbon binding protein